MQSVRGYCTAQARETPRSCRPFPCRTTIRTAPAVCRNCTRTSSPRPAPFDRYVATCLCARRQTYDDVPASGLSLCGTPDAVAGMGGDHVMALHNFGRMPRAAVLESMSALAQEALPRAGLAALAA